jgi:enamine deaminase RidA (YjgF/YER057c/UK114 family)
MSFKAIRSSKMVQTTAPISLATLSEGKRILHISGQVAMDRNGNTVGRSDIEVQAIQAMENIKTLVEEAGGTLADVCRIVVFVTSREYLSKVMEVRRRFLSEPFPATTTVVAAGLANPDWLVEIEATAVLE